MTNRTKTPCNECGSTFFTAQQNDNGENTWECNNCGHHTHRQTRNTAKRAKINNLLREMFPDMY